jgi:hypothetical protein
MHDHNNLRPELNNQGQFYKMLEETIIFYILMALCTSSLMPKHRAAYIFEVSELM